jgi:hypothetical protein
VRLTDEAIKKFEKQLSDLQGMGDWEAAHSIADDVLCEVLTALGYEGIVEAWDKVGKWYA